MLNNELRIAVIGLGYVGLPLAIEFAKKYNVVGFDINSEKINKYRKGIDCTEEVGDNLIVSSTCRFTSNPSTVLKKQSISDNYFNHKHS